MPIKRIFERLSVKIVSGRLSYTFMSISPKKRAVRMIVRGNFIKLQSTNG